MLFLCDAGRHVAHPGPECCEQTFRRRDAQLRATLAVWADHDPELRDYLTSHTHWYQKHRDAQLN